MYCILISGIPASGKSTTAKMLSQTFQIPCFSKDAIKERLFDTVGFSSRAEKMKLNLAATLTLYDIAEQLMKNNLPFILENNFENQTADGIKSLIDRYSYKAISVVLTGDYRKIYERFCERQKSPDRHRGHVVNERYPETEPARDIPPMPYEHYVGGITARGMDRFRIDGENIVVDTTEIGTVDWSALLDRINRLVKEVRR